MPTNTSYTPEYNNSYALIIGINKYTSANPLIYAKNDAEEFADLLIQNFNFQKENVRILIDKEATRQNIHESYLNFAGSKINPNDRIIFYFAGHGHTVTGSRGEVGFLVPVDGDTSKLSSLISWKELTNKSELIEAKHLFFIMDACYGGLAITRSAHTGKMRFLKDMLQRYSRQVLTAGKADELVADAGGPREKHSIFTGHLLDALEGAAKNSNDVITAHSVMSYVYNHVAKDYESKQSPHFGFLDGDGDFVFNTEILSEIPSEEEKDSDLLMELPVSDDNPENEFDNKVDKIKEYLTDPRYRIKLDDLVNEELRNVLQKTSEDKFPLDIDDVSMGTLKDRMKEYESVVKSLQRIVILIAKWGKKEHKSTLEKIFSRLADNAERKSGKIALLGLRWYPCHYLMYSGGIAALSSQNYDNLYSIFSAKVGAKITGKKSEKSVKVAYENGIRKLHRVELFKKMPGYEKNYVPKSEYLFKQLQPELEDLLFLGRSYENIFDRIELFMSLEYANISYQGDRFWMPLGRFAYKYRSGGMTDNPFKEMVNEFKKELGNWKPLKAGFFNEDHERFRELIEEAEEYIQNLGWY